MTMDIIVDDYTREVARYQAKTNMVSRFIDILDALDIYAFEYYSYITFKILIMNWE